MFLRREMILKGRFQMVENIIGNSANELRAIQTHSSNSAPKGGKGGGNSVLLLREIILKGIS
jgi:hypothetical protein